MSSANDKPLARAKAAFDNLGDDPSREGVENAPATLTEEVRAKNGNLGAAHLAMVRDIAVHRLKTIAAKKREAGEPSWIQSATGLVDGAIRDGRAKPEPATEAAAAKYADRERWPAEVNGDELLGELADLIAPYVHVEPEKIDAIAAWVIATYFVDRVYCAAILAVIAPTKESGRTRLPDLIAPLVRRPHLTSGAGITVATMFRIQDRYCPTMLVDEAEKLSSVKGAAELIALFNDGHTRGGVVTRCVRA